MVDDSVQKEGEKKHDQKPAPPANDDLVRTGVDDLINLLETTDRISVDQAAKKLDMDKKILTSWIDFLNEEKIIGIEYSFTTPYIYLNKPKESKKSAKKIKEVKMTYQTFKDEFFEKAKHDKIPEQKIPEYWQRHLQQRLEVSKEFFMREVKKRNIPMGDKLWKKYTEKALSV